MSDTMDVLVVGAGPTGLLLAGDLAAAGVACTVLERRAGESNLTRAFAVHARTLEQLDARGLADELIRTGRPVRGLHLFGNIEIDLSSLPSRFPYLLVTPQYETERVLEERARASGVTIVQGDEVLAVTQYGGGERIDVRSRTASGDEVTRSARYVVGADGVHSAVRTSLGASFRGRSAVKSVMLADVKLRHPPEETLTVNAVEAGFAFLAPFGDGWYRVIAWDRHRQMPDDAPVRLDEVRNITRAALGTDYGMTEARWLSRFHSDERQTDSYRIGNVFLAGDAAHVHSPAGGQGLNTGLQDAANLSWKLALAVQGKASAGLLDSYHGERHPVGSDVLRTSGALLRAAMLRRAPARAVRQLVGTLGSHIGPIARRAAEEVSGIGMRYPTIPGDPSAAGVRVLDVPLLSRDPGPARLYEALRQRRFILLEPGHRAPLDLREPAEEIVVTQTASPSDVSRLVRPDGYLAWSSDTGDLEARKRQAHIALRRWFRTTDATERADPRERNSQRALTFLV